MKKAEIKNLDGISLRKEIDGWKKELLNLKLNKMSGQIKDFTQFKKLRANVARALSHLNQVEKDKKD
ncbi:50S ribosomal protein L29 [Candidatus Babeliales bacterium]|nr:50S ribosomal protein L29 [Candidatus Babeliales bacterium]